MQADFESLWLKTAEGKKYPPLEKNTSVDIAIVGGGLAGLMAAYFLLKRGYKATIFEANQIAAGTSGNTTAKITSLHDLKYAFLEKEIGLEGARIYGQSNQWAIGELKRIIETEKIECDFKMAPAHVFAQSEDELEEIKAEVKSAQKINLPASFLEKDDKIPFAIKGEIKFEDQAYFHPRKFILAIAEILEREGVMIYENTRIEDVEEEEKDCKLKAGTINIYARKVIIATNYPIYDKALFFARMNQMRSYALAAKIEGPLPESMYIGAGAKGVTFRPHKSAEGEWLVIGGQDQPTGELKEDSDPFEKLEAQARHYYSIKSVDYKWAAQDSNLIDRIPCIGKMPQSENIFVTTGFGEWGMTTSVVSAKISADLISGETNEWEKLYTPSRFKPKASIKGAPAHLGRVVKGFGSYVTKHEEFDQDKLQPDEGKVFNYQGEKVGVYKDRQGDLHAVSAKCTHMGCIVNWNHTEKSWDCPCHGSRFDASGKILNSPAKKPLPTKKIME